MPPFVDDGVVAGGEDGRNIAAFPDLRAGIMRMFQQSALEAFMHAGKIVAHNARQDTDDGVKKRQRRRLTAGEDVIADRHFLEPARLDHPLVDTFETAADDDRTFTRCQFAHALLGQRLAARAHQEARACIAIRNMVDGGCQHIGL